MDKSLTGDPWLMDKSFTGDPWLVDKSLQEIPDWWIKAPDHKTRTQFQQTQHRFYPIEGPTSPMIGWLYFDMWNVKIVVPSLGWKEITQMMYIWAYLQFWGPVFCQLLFQ